jgi:hypothetical protein
MIDADAEKRGDPFVLGTRIVTKRLLFKEVQQTPRAKMCGKVAKNRFAFFRVGVREMIRVALMTPAPGPCGGTGGILQCRQLVDGISGLARNNVGVAHDALDVLPSE